MTACTCWACAGGLGYHQIESHDIMDTAEVAERLGVAMSSIQVALAAPHRHPALAAKLPAPFRKVGRSWVWRRTDIEQSLRITQGETQ